ncbi:hypothetical protein KC723_01225 [Candidatus Kaiserbacteria bacterium]|nr:hypothetical protein [Candidatus Kaiserbacteria bacterium]
MSEALMYIAVSGSLFILFLAFFSWEEKRGKRMFASGFRTYLDKIVVWVADKCIGAYQYMIRHIIQLSWYYSLHAFLKTCLMFTATIYHAIESLLRQNRQKAKLIRAERRKDSILGQIADHKESIQLTDQEKAKLKAKSIER